MTKPLIYEGIIQNCETAGIWGGKALDSIASFADETHGPETRVRFVGTYEALQALAPKEGAQRWLVPDDEGVLSVDHYNTGQGQMDCVVMQGNRPIITDGVRAVSVEKWVYRDKIRDQYPLGKRFSFVDEKP